MNLRVAVAMMAAVAGVPLSISVQGPGVSGHVLQAQQRKPRVFVIALKEAGLLTMCPGIVEAKLAGGASWKPNGQVVATDDRLDGDLQLLTIMPFRPTAEQRRLMADDPRLRSRLASVSVRLPKPAGESFGAQGTSPSLLDRVLLDAGLAVTDALTRSAIEAEVARQKRYQVVASADTADYVLIADATYVTRSTNLVPGASRTTISGRAGERNRGNYVEAVDHPPNLRQSLLAILVPGDAYRRSPADIGSLLRSRVWEGSVLMQPPYNYQYSDPVSETRYSAQRKTYEDASPESLVRQLHGKEGRVNSHPVLCAASNGLFQLFDPHWPLDGLARDLLAATPPPVATSPTGTSFSAAVLYVPVSVAVTDAATGDDVRDLASSEFRVFENDIEQKVDRVITTSHPFTLALLIDSSTSMQSRVADIQQAALSFVDAVRPDDQLMVVSFDRRIFRQAPMTQDRDRLRRGLFQIEKADGTRLFDAIGLTVTEPSFTGANRKALVMVSDGIDTQSRLADSVAILARAGETNMPIYAVQFEETGSSPAPRQQLEAAGAGTNQATSTSALKAAEAATPTRSSESAGKFLNRLATSTGGQFYRASTVNDVSKALARVAHDLSVQYTVCYYPSNNALDGTYRRIRIRLSRSGVVARARDGYTALRQGRLPTPRP